MTLFLSHICPLGIRLESSVTWDESTVVADETALAIECRCEKWNKAVELLALLTGLRLEEWENARLLQSEVEDLRLRTGLFTDKVSMKDNSRGGACAIA